MCIYRYFLVKTELLNYFLLFLLSSHYFKLYQMKNTFTLTQQAIIFLNYIFLLVLVAICW